MLLPISSKSCVFQGVLSIVDTFVSSSPRRMAHMWAPVVFGLVYLIFNVAYTLSGGTDPVGHPYIYPITDWLNKPGKVTIPFNFDLGKTYFGPEEPTLNNLPDLALCTNRQGSLCSTVLDQSGTIFTSNPNQNELFEALWQGIPHDV